MSGLLLQARAAAPAPVALRRARIALAGCGTVGGSLIRLLRERRTAIEREQGVRFDVVGVLVRDLHRPRIVESAAGVLTNDLRAWLGHDAEIVVEATGAPDVAVQIARATLTRGRCFVTANKALIAAHGPELAALAHTHGGRLHFEASVGGGVPVVRVLREALRHTAIKSVRGVLNGTCNYILTRVAAGESFAEALRQARWKGFAEADASRDLDGRDAADKIAILAWLAFGTDPSVLPVLRRGLEHDIDAMLAAAAVHGGVLRQLAECFLWEGGVSAVVEPVILPPTSPFAQAAGEENCVAIETRRSGTIRLSGPGAGGPPSAAALLSDVLQAALPEPGPRATAPSPRADERLHAWAITTPSGGVAPVLEALGAHGVGVEWVRTAPPSRLHALTTPVQRSQVTAALRALEQAGLSPVAVRTEAG